MQNFKEGETKNSLILDNRFVIDYAFGESCTVNKLRPIHHAQMGTVEVAPCHRLKNDGLLPILHGCI